MPRLVARAALAIALASCAGGPGGGGGLEVVAGFYPLAEAAARVGGDAVTVIDLTPPGAEPHDLELDAQAIARIGAADVVLAIRGFQPALDDAAAGHPGLLDVGAGAGDPHVWLDPQRMADIARDVAAALGRADPARAGAFRARADAFATELEAVDAAFRDGLARCARDLIVTSHDAFGHLASAYGVRVEPIAGTSPEGEPDPRRLADLVALVRSEDVTTIFTEPLVPPHVAQTLARETGARIATLDPLESLAPERVAGGEDYASVMRDNLDALRAGLGCR